MKGGLVIVNRITRNNDFIEYFVRGGRDQKNCNNLHIRGDKLFSYNTVIAQVGEDGYLYINMTKYSTSTSRIQNYLLKQAEYWYYSAYIVLDEDIRMNRQSLI